MWLLSRLNNRTRTIFHRKTPFFKRFTMEYTSCVIVKSTSHSHKHDNPLQNTIFLAFYNGIYGLCGLWVRLKSRTNTIFCCKTPFFKRFTMEYTIGVGHELDSWATQTRYSIAKHHFFSVLQWNIRFVWVLSRTQQPHKHDIPSQNTIFLAFCDEIYDLRA